MQHWSQSRSYGALHKADTRRCAATHRGNTAAPDHPAGRYAGPDGALSVIPPECAATVPAPVLSGSALGETHPLLHPGNTGHNPRLAAAQVPVPSGKVPTAAVKTALGRMLHHFLWQHPAHIPAHTRHCAPECVPTAGNNTADFPDWNPDP